LDIGSGIATGWTGVGLLNPLLVEVATEMDTNPGIFVGGRMGGVIRPSSTLAMSVHPTYFDLATPWVWGCQVIVFKTPDHTSNALRGEE